MGENKNYPMKDENKKKKDSKPEEEIDFESLYYKAMKENVLLKDNKIGLEFTAAEIELLRNVMYEELFDIVDKSYVNPSFDEDEENKILQKETNPMLKSLMDEKTEIIQRIIKKLRFEI